MFEDISNLSSSDPKVSKAAALNIIQHVSQNKTELGYLVKRLVSGLESTKIHTRKGCYTTLAVLLRLQKIEWGALFDLMQKALITNKQSTRKERRLIYIARILCCGSILKATNAATLSKQGHQLQNILHDLVDLSLKKSSYFQLTTPFLTHLLCDNTLTQEVFDGVVWPAISGLFESLLTGSGKKRKRKEDDEDNEEDRDDEEEENDVDAVNFTCCVQLALVCKNGTYREEFDCLKDVGKIVKALLVSKLQFEGVFLKSLFKSIKESHEDVKLFWTTLVDGIKPTQFELLCESVEKAVEEQISPTFIISKALVRLLLSVFNTKETDFHAKARFTIQLLLNWNDKDGNSRLSKKERKSALKCLFGGEVPNLLHEYTKLNSTVRSLISKLKGKDLDVLRAVLYENLEDEKLGVRMAIVYLNILGRIAVCSKIGDETMFEVGKKLISIATGVEVISIKAKADEQEDEDFDVDEVQLRLRTCAREGIKTIMSSSYNINFMDKIWEFITGSIKELSGNPETIRICKDAKKALKKTADPHLRYVLCAYTLRVLLDEKEILSASMDGARELIELSGSAEAEGEIVEEIIKFIVNKVVREVSPCFSIEGLFTRLMIEGRVGEGVIQELASSVEIDVEEGDIEDESDDDDDDDNSESGGEEEDESVDEDGEPSAKKTKLDPAQIAKLKDAFGGNDDNGSDSEESIALEDATSEDLEKMDGALAKVFAIKKVAKDEDNSTVRGLMRTLRLIEMFVARHIKCMSVSSMLILLMPIVNCLKGSLKLKKFGDVTTRVIGVVDNMCRVKKFSGLEQVLEGTLGTIAGEIYGIGRERKFKILRELMEHCVLMLVKCYLGTVKSKRDSKPLLKIFVDAVDEANGKLKRRKKRKVRVGRKNRKEPQGLETSRFVRLALDTIGNEWKDGRKKIEERIRAGKQDAVVGANQ